MTLWENACSSPPAETDSLVDKADVICQRKSGQASRLAQNRGLLSAGVAVTYACQTGLLLRLWLSILNTRLYPTTNSFTDASMLLLETTVCRHYTCQPTSPLQGKLVAVLGISSCPWGYPGLGRLFLQLRLWYDLRPVCISLEM